MESEPRSQGCPGRIRREGQKVPGEEQEAAAAKEHGDGRKIQDAGEAKLTQVLS